MNVVWLCKNVKFVAYCNKYNKNPVPQLTNAVSIIVHTMQFTLTYIRLPVKNEHGAKRSPCRADSEVLKNQRTLYIYMYIYTYIHIYI